MRGLELCRRGAADRFVSARRARSLSLVASTRLGPCARYAIWGTATVPRSSGVGLDDRQAVRERRLHPGRRRRRGQLRPQHVRSGRSEGIQARLARDVLCGVLRAPRCARGCAQGELPDARPHALQRRPLARAGQGRLVHDHGARHVPRRRRPGGDLRASRAARDLEARYRQRVDPRSRARALGRRRGHGGHRLGRSPPRRARPPALTLPGRGVPLGSRSPPCHAAVLGGRALVQKFVPPERTRPASG